jgi:23S rRNA (guanosine2251-2'-O)-methyltransferase
VPDPDGLLVVYGRRPVLEALADERVPVDEVLVSRKLKADDVVAAAKARGVPLRFVTPDKVTRVSGNGRHDQGLVALVRPAPVPTLSDSLPAGAVLVLDGVTNPQNVGMIVRSAAAFGLTVVLPDAGSPGVGPLVVKASAGIALFAPIRRCATAAEAVRLLRQGGFRLLGLAAEAPLTLWDAPLTADEPVAFVLGSETAGVSVEVDEWVAIPIGGGVESLNVSVAAGIVCAEVARRRRSD